MSSSMQVNISSPSGREYPYRDPEDPSRGVPSPSKHPEDFHQPYRDHKKNGRRDSQFEQMRYNVNDLFGDVMCSPSTSTAHTAAPSGEVTPLNESRVGSPPSTLSVDIARVASRSISPNSDPEQYTNINLEDRGLTPTQTPPRSRSATLASDSRSLHEESYSSSSSKPPQSTSATPASTRRSFYHEPTSSTRSSRDDHIMRAYHNTSHDTGHDYSECPSEADDTTDDEGFGADLEEQTYNGSKFHDVSIRPDSDCSLCNGKETDAKIILLCTHFFHTKCLVEKMQTKSECPTCQTHIDFPRIHAAVQKRSRKTLKFLGVCILSAGLSSFVTGLTFYFAYYKPLEKHDGD